MRSSAYFRPSCADFVRGFSLIELMVVLTIAAILTMIAVPNFQTLIDRQKISTVAADLYASVVLARSEAIRQGARVDIKPLAPGDWALGWQVIGPQGNLIYERKITPNGMQLKQIPPPGGSSLYVTYDGTGRTRLTSSPVPWSGHFDIGVNATSRQLWINDLGRPSVCNPEITPVCLNN